MKQGFIKLFFLLKKKYFYNIFNLKMSIKTRPMFRYFYLNYTRQNGAN